jgi:hypothetical protein
MKKKRKTAGELSLKATCDKTKYDPLDIGYALTADIIQQVFICAESHIQKFDEQEYFICLNIASDPLIKGIRRHKYAAFLYLPSPRPLQSCFIFNKLTQKIKRLWSLPSAPVMEELYMRSNVSPQFKKTKEWIHAFYDGYFWQQIRKENNFNHLSEIEYLKTNRQKLIDAGAKDGPAPDPEPFDFSKIQINHIENTTTSHNYEPVFNNLGEA